MNELKETRLIIIEEKIHEINGIQVMTDYDLAEVYGTETKKINQAVSRNPIKFPLKYSWILSDEESKNFLVTHCDQKIETRGGRYKNPRVFTEQAVAMLATILKTPKAVQTSLAIMDAFVKMRHFIIDNDNLYKSISNINNKLTIHDEKIEYLFFFFFKKEQLIIKGQFFEAYSSILDTMSRANNEIIVVDNYADKLFLELIKNIKCNVVLITKNSDRLNSCLIEKYQEEYHNLKVVRDNSIHDRLIIIDKNEIYLCGSSINGLGNKTSMIIRLEDKKTIKMLLSRIDEIVNNPDYYTDIKNKSIS